MPMPYADVSGIHLVYEEHAVLPATTHMGMTSSDLVAAVVETFLASA
jgi:hypothetical protein